MEAKQNFIVKYLSDVKSELKKVVWPTKKDTINHSLLVIGISIVVAVFLGALDFLFSKIVETIL